MKDESYKDFILDQLVDIEDLVAKKMFGGFGLYSRGFFFGIISSDVLYFKTDDQTRQRFIGAGMDCFRASDGQVLKNYFEVPPDVIESREEIGEWAQDAIEVSERAHS